MLGYNETLRELALKSHGNRRSSLASVLWPCLLLLLMGCKSNDVVCVDSPAPAALATEAASIEVASNSMTAAPGFAIEEHVEAAKAGLVGDGATDNTDAFRRLLGMGNRAIHVPAGDYVTGSLEIPGGTVLVLDSGVTIRDSGHLGPNDCLLNIRKDNVFVEAPGARVIANRSDYTTDEQRHGVFIFGASNVVIKGLESSGHGGDGFYIGGPSGRPSRNVVLKSCLASNNRRQGLSITSAQRVLVVDCTFQDTSGTAPQFGIDVEPNDPTDFVDQIRILRPRTVRNLGGGISLYLDALKATSPAVDIAVIYHRSQEERVAFQPHGPPWLPAHIRYSSDSH
jgi:hypothetical protein